MDKKQSRIDSLNRNLTLVDATIDSIASSPNKKSQVRITALKNMMKERNAIMRELNILKNEK